MTKTADVVVVGNGPAGLQAALTLARGQRSVVVVTGTVRRNARAHALHNVITWDGVAPAAFRDAAWADLDGYGVERVVGDVRRVSGVCGAFEVAAGDTVVRCRRVLLATGVLDQLPAWPGLDALWGPTVFQCPFCHGHEVRGRRWAVRVPGREAAEHIPLFPAWTSDLVVLTDGWEPDPSTRADLEAHGVEVVTGAIVGLVARGDAPDRLGAVTTSAGTVRCDALVVHPAQGSVDVVESLGLARDASGNVQIDAMGRTSVPGVSAAGDATTRFQSAVAAMASGQLAAGMVCHDLAREDWTDGR